MSSDAGALVIKRSKAIGAEFFCGCLALKLGIQSPLVLCCAFVLVLYLRLNARFLLSFFIFQMRIVATNEEYGVRMLMTLVGKDPMGRVRATLYEQNFLILMQYQRGMKTQLFVFKTCYFSPMIIILRQFRV